MSRLLTHHTPGRLTLLCGLFAALFAALGALAFITATEARRHAGHLAGVDLPATAAIARLQTAAVDLERDLALALLVEDPDGFQAAARRVAQRRATVRASLQELRGLALGGEARARLDTLERAVAAWEAAIDQALGSPTLTTHDASAQDALTAAWEQAPTIHQAARDLAAYQEQATSATAQAADAAASRAAHALLAALAAALLTAPACALAAAAVRDRATTEGTHPIAATPRTVVDLDEPDPQPETRRLAAAFHRLMAYLQDLARVADALAVGDLSKEVHPRSEHDLLGLALQRMTANLRQVVRQLQALSAQLHMASSQLEQVAAATRSPVERLATSLATLGESTPHRAILDGQAAVEHLGRAIEHVVTVAQRQARTAATTQRVLATLQDAVQAVDASVPQVVPSVGQGPRPPHPAPLRQALDSMASTATLLQADEHPADTRSATMTHVLLVDDAAFMRARCARILREHGYSVEEATNGIEAIDRYRARRPDAVLLNVTMPGMDGLTTLQEIRHLDPTARVAMVSANGQESVVIEAFQHGARDFILKPFQPERLIEAVQRLLR
ncbi:MAG TPA: response regulator [Chloroflexota bacterium]